VLGANDGIVSTASLMLGVAATSAATSAVVTAGFAGLVAGALSMASGEYVSVSSQRDSELADLRTEQQELADYPEAELRELTEIYVRRGLDRDLAREVAHQLHRHDALGAHLRDELNLTVDEIARPVQAAVTSAVSFAVGAAIPVLVGWWTRGGVRLVALALASLVGLAAIGLIGARLGGALGGRAAARVLIGGGLAMAITTLIGRLVGVVG
jgi:VIT1/CCC1 family predicted Fe2+/Mn2+ transporter